MSENKNSVVIFTQASRLLAEANTIQKAKELKNLALTAAEWAKRKGMGEEAVKYARDYALDAERKMGEMVIAEEQAGRLATRGNTNPSGKRKTCVPTGYTGLTTTADIGITRKERA